MTDERDPRELRELLGAYALGALDDDERAEVERFLMQHPEARSELHALQLGAAWLARSEPPVPERVWSGIAAEVEADLAAAPEPVDSLAPGDEAARRTRRPRRRRVLALAAAAVALVAATFVVVEITGGGEASPPVSVAARAHAAQGSPDARFVDLTAPTGSASASVVTLPDGTAFLVSSSLPRLTADQTYQLWSLTPTGPVSEGVLGRSPGIHEFHFPRDASAMAITVERAGGSRAPHGLPTVIGTLPT